MNKRFIIFVSAVLAGGLVVLVIVKSLYRTDHIDFSEKDYMERALEVNGGLRPAASAAEENPKGPIRLAIGSLGFPDDAQNQQLGDMVVAELSSAPGLELVDRQSLAKVLKESELSLSGLVRAKDAVRVGKLIRADWFLLGSPALSGETNAMVARVVSARTGVLRDVKVFNYDKHAISTLSGPVAGFVRDCRANAVSRKLNEYLAFGVFEDLSLNDRQAGLPEELRANLTAAYRNEAGKTLLERGAVNALLHEVELDLAGLTDETNSRAMPMQSAFWLIDGTYQSYETSDMQVEVVLRIHRIFGRTSTVKLRSKPGEPLYKQIKEAVDATMAKVSSRPVAPTRMSEINEQMGNGKELSTLSKSDLLWAPGSYHIYSEDRRGRNMQEAISAFETVLLLDPENHQAKLYLASCLRLINRESEAQEYYEQLIKSPAQDQWTKTAASALKWNEERGRRLPRNAAVDADTAKKAEALMMSQMRECVKTDREGQGSMVPAYGMLEFVGSFGTNAQAAAKRLNELLPEMKKEFPDHAPHFLAAALTFQTDTNAPMVAEFQKSLAECREHPEALVKADSYFQDLTYGPYDWCMQKKFYTLALQIMEAKKQFSSSRRRIWPFDEQDKIRMVYAYARMGKWPESIAILNELHDKPINMGGAGIWGRAFDPVLPSEFTAFCRKKMGIPEPEDRRIFAVGKARLGFDSQPVFITDQNGLWIAADAQLLNLDFDEKTNLAVRLPTSGRGNITALCQSATKLYVGTAGEGLIVYDKENHKFKHLTYHDGLLMDDISCLTLQGQTLWIGFGADKEGGLGKLDISSGKISSFTPSLALDAHEAGIWQGDAMKDPADGPPRHKVTGMAAGEAGDLWIDVYGKGLRVHNIAKNSWEPFTLSQSYPAMTKQQREMMLGLIGGDLIPKFVNGHWDNSQVAEGLPDSQITTLTIHGDDLWVGGYGFIAAVDMKQKKVRKLCYLHTRQVDHIDFAGGYLWAQFNWRLFRIPISELN